MFASDYPKDYPEPESIVAILRRKKKVKEIPVIMKERSGGVSSISAGKSIYYMIKVSLAILIEIMPSLFYFLYAPETIKAIIPKPLAHRQSQHNNTLLSVSYLPVRSSLP